MASHSGSAGGFIQTGARPASADWSRCETLLTKNRDLGWNEGVNRARCRSDNGLRLQNYGDGLVGPGSKDFELRVLSFANSVPCHLRTKSITSESSSDSHETTVAPFAPIADERSDLEDVGNPSIASYRSASPRSQFRNARSRLLQEPSKTHLNPMERYLVEGAGQKIIEDHTALSEQEWNRLKFLRIQAIQLRSQLRSKRRELHARQSTKSVADDNFMKLIRNSSVNPNVFTSGPLNVEYEKMQAARDEYGPFEDDYNIMEEKLDDIDFEMAKYEARLIPATEAEGIRNLIQPEVTDLTQNSLLGLSPTPVKESHPLRASYFSRLGDHDLLIERYQNIEQEYERIQYKISRAALGLDLELQEYEHTFLEDFPSFREKLMLDISEVEKDIEGMRGEAEAKGIDLTESFSEDGSSSQSDDSLSEPNTYDEESANVFNTDTSTCDFEEERANLPHADTISDNLNRERPRSESSSNEVIVTDLVTPTTSEVHREPLAREATVTDIIISPTPEINLEIEHNMDPGRISNMKFESDDDILQNLEQDGISWTFRILIPPFDKDDTAIQDLLTTYDERNKGNRINRWMLHQLRISHLEVELLIRILFHFLGICSWQQFPMTVAEWQDKVLLSWEEDGANRAAEDFSPLPTETLIVSTVPSTNQSGRLGNLSTAPKYLGSLELGSNSEQRGRSAPASLTFVLDMIGSEFMSKIRPETLK